VPAATYQILEASIEVRGSDPTGEVKEGLDPATRYLITINFVRPSKSSPEWEIAINGVLVKLTRNLLMEDLDEGAHKLNRMLMK
jgi:hypothetical protein